MKSYRTRLTALLLGAGFLFSAAASASQALHDCVHPEAAAESHVCVVTLFSLQQILSGDPGVILAPPVSRPVPFRLPEILPSLPAADLALAPSRAPPQFLFSHGYQ